MPHIAATVVELLGSLLELGERTARDPSESRLAPRAKSGPGFFGIMLQEPHFRSLRDRKGGRGARGRVTMNDSPSFLAAIDHLCSQFATALHNAEWQVYATLALLIVLSILLVPPRDDLHQV